MKEKRLELSKNYLGHGRLEHIYRQTARNQLQGEIKRNKKKWWRKEMREREELETHGNGMGWRGGSRKKDTESYPETMRHTGLCPTLRKTGLCQAAVRKWTSWSRNVAFHPTLLPNALIHDGQADQLGLGLTWIASLLPLVLKILWSPKIKSAMKIRYLWNKEGWQRRGKQQKDNNKMNYIITNIWLNATRFIIACFIQIILLVFLTT